jgi:hypothetical protein
MAHITIQDFWKSENTLANFKIRGCEIFRIYIKMLRTCRFCAKLMDVKSSKNKTNNHNNNNNNNNNNKSGEGNIYAMVQ